MKLTSLTLLSALLITLTFTACNSSKSKSLDNDSHQQASTQTRGFPTVKRPSKDVVCHNCYSTFKLSRAIQKQSHGNNYIACPICHKNYLKKAK